MKGYKCPGCKKYNYEQLGITSIVAALAALTFADTVQTQQSMLDNVREIILSLGRRFELGDLDVSYLHIELERALNSCVQDEID